MNAGGSARGGQGDGVPPGASRAVPPGQQSVAVITLADVPPVELAGGSWSRVLVAEQTVGGNVSALGYSVFKPGTSTADLSHSVEELAYIVSGSGVIRLETGDVPVAAGQALYVPARLWHTVVNPGGEDLVMVFSFPSPGYPPTERRDPAVAPSANEYIGWVWITAPTSGRAR